LTKAVLVHIIK